MFHSITVLNIVSLACRVQMANLSTVLTTSFHTKLSFMDADSEEILEDKDEEDDYDENEDDEDKVHSFSSSGISLLFFF